MDKKGTMIYLIFSSDCPALYTGCGLLRLSNLDNDLILNKYRLYVCIDIPLFFARGPE